MFTLLIGVLQAQYEKQKGVNDDVPSLTEVTHLKVVELTMRIYFPFLYKKGVVNACFFNNRIQFDHHHFFKVVFSPN